MIFQFLLIQLTQGIITQSLGDVTQFSYTVSGFNCQNGYTSTITFPSSFANIPKLILFPNLFDIASISSSQPTARIDIVSVTLTNFQIKLTCPYQKINTYQLKWYAIDDDRIEVINEPNLNPLASKQYSIQNPNIKKAIVSIIGVGYKGSFDVTLSISELTSTSVTVNVNNANSNLVLLGYQIILGTDEVITYIDKITSSNVYTSQQYPLQSNSYYILAFNKIGLPNTGIITLRTTITLVPLLLIMILQDVRFLQIVLGNSGVYTPNIIQSFWLQYTLNYPFLAMECFTVRISKLFDMNSDQKPAFELEISELNKVVNTIGSESIIINDSITLLHIHVYYKCPSNNKKVHSQLNKCNNCSGTNKIYNLYHYCHGSMNSINIYAKYNAQNNYKQLTLTTTSNSITIAQKLINRSTTQQNILFVEFLDI